MKRQRVGNQFWLFVLLFATLSLAYPVTSAVSAPANSTDTVTTTNNTILDTTLAAVTTPAPTSSGPVSSRSRRKRRLGHVDVGPFWGYGVELDSYQVLEDTTADAGSTPSSANGERPGRTERIRKAEYTVYDWRAQNAAPFAPQGYNLTAELEKKVVLLEKEIRQKDGAVAHLQMTDARRELAMKELQASSKAAISIKDETIELQAKRLREADDAAKAHERKVAELEAVIERQAVLRQEDAVRATQDLAEKQDIIDRVLEDLIRTNEELASARAVVLQQHGQIQQHATTENLLRLLHAFLVAFALALASFILGRKPDVIVELRDVYIDRKVVETVEVEVEKTVEVERIVVEERIVDHEVEVERIVEVDRIVDRPVEVIREVDRVVEVERIVYIERPHAPEPAQFVDAPEASHQSSAEPLLLTYPGWPMPADVEACPAVAEWVNVSEIAPQVFTLPSLLANNNHSSVQAWQVIPPRSTQPAVAVRRGQTSNVWNEDQIVTSLGPLILPPSMTALNRSNVMAFLVQRLGQGLTVVRLRDRHEGDDGHGQGVRDLDIAGRNLLLEYDSDIVASVIQATDNLTDTSPHDGTQAAEPSVYGMDAESSVMDQGQVAPADHAPAPLETTVDETTAGEGMLPGHASDVVPPVVQEPTAAEDTLLDDESQAVEPSVCAVDVESVAPGQGQVAPVDHAPAPSTTTIAEMTADEGILPEQASIDVPSVIQESIAAEDLSPDHKSGAVEPPVCAEVEDSSDMDRGQVASLDDDPAALNTTVAERTPAKGILPEQASIDVPSVIQESIAAEDLSPDHKSGAVEPPVCAEVEDSSDMDRGQVASLDDDPAALNTTVAERTPAKGILPEQADNDVPSVMQEHTAAEETLLDDESQAVEPSVRAVDVESVAPGQGQVAPADHAPAPVATTVDETTADEGMLPEHASNVVPPVKQEFTAAEDLTPDSKSQAFKRPVCGEDADSSDRDQGQVASLDDDPAALNATVDETTAGEGMLPERASDVVPPVIQESTAAEDLSPDHESEAVKPSVCAEVEDSGDMYQGQVASRDDDPAAPITSVAHVSAEGEISLLASVTDVTPPPIRDLIPGEIMVPIAGLVSETSSVCAVDVDDRGTSKAKVAPPDVLPAAAVPNTAETVVTRDLQNSNELPSEPCIAASTDKQAPASPATRSTAPTISGLGSNLGDVQSNGSEQRPKKYGKIKQDKRDKLKAEYESHKAAGTLDVYRAQKEAERAAKKAEEEAANRAAAAAAAAAANRNRASRHRRRFGNEAQAPVDTRQAPGSQWPAARPRYSAVVETTANAGSASSVANRGPSFGQGNGARERNGAAASVASHNGPPRAVSARFANDTAPGFRPANGGHGWNGAIISVARPSQPPRAVSAQPAQPTAEPAPMFRQANSIRGGYGPSSYVASTNASRPVNSLATSIHARPSATTASNPRHANNSAREGRGGRGGRGGQNRGPRREG